MIDKCFNPDCDKQLRYLRDGRVVRVLRRENDKTFVQHYWLCGSCYDEYDFAFPSEGGIAIEHRSHAHSDKVQIGDVLVMPRASWSLYTVGEVPPMADDHGQEFRIDIFKLLRDELSVSVHYLGDEADPHTTTLSGEAFTRLLRERFGLDDHRLCGLGMDLAAHGRAALTLHCTHSDLRAAQLIPPS
jgi:hypothetical protein